jgi:hypothetical protein
MVSNKTVLLGGLLSVLIGSFSVDTMAADYGRGNSCRRGVRAWKVRIRFDGRRDCETDIVVREGNTIAGNVRDFKLRPGVNEIEIPAGEGFRLRGREHCFNVQVDLDGSRQQIDADRRFCASQRSAWSMREPDDRRRSDR